LPIVVGFISGHGLPAPKSYGPRIAHDGYLLKIIIC
jgi:hypothetical protein